MLCSEKYPVTNKLMDEKGGSIKVFSRDFFVSKCQIFL